MLPGDVAINPLTHKKIFRRILPTIPMFSAFRADLANSESPDNALEGTGVIVHFAGILFEASPEKFLPTTNTAYFKNLLDAAVRQKVRRVILTSSPHTEGKVTPENQACGFELSSWLFGTRSPLTVDLIRIGMTSYCGDTSSMREKPLPELTCRTYREGLESL